MLTVRKVTEGSPEFDRIVTLYERSFPENERRPLEPLLRDSTGSSDFLSFFSENTFVGFAALLTLGDISHILYFAIEEHMRNSGFGSEALRCIHRLKAGCRILADLEAEDPGAANNDQRKKRRRFYLLNGYTVSEVHYRWRQESYEIFVCGGDITNEEFAAFWHHFEQTDSGLSQY